MKFKKGDKVKGHNDREFIVQKVYQILDEDGNLELMDVKPLSVYPGDHVRTFKGYPTCNFKLI